MSVQGALLGGAAGAGASMGTGFGIGTGLAGGAILGSQLSGLNTNRGYSSYRSHMSKLWGRQLGHQEKQYEQQQAFQRALELQMPAWKRQGAIAAGYHPLAALGISTGQSSVAGSVSSPAGQSSRGSEIAQGASNYLQYKSAMLGLEQQKLQNDLIRDQIIGSKISRVSQLANAAQDTIKAGTTVRLSKLLDRKGYTPKGLPPIKVKAAEKYEHTTPATGYNLFGHIPIRQRSGKLTPEAAESAMGEPGGWLYSPFSIAQDIGYTLDSMYRDPATGRVTKGTDPWKVDPFGYDYSP